MYTLENLISFGNFLFEVYGVRVFSNDGQNLPLYQRTVCDPDINNWLVGQKAQGKILTHYQIGDKAFFTLDTDNQGAPAADCEILCVHIYMTKIKYDIEVTLCDGTPTRLYNIDSCFVVSRRVS